MIWPFSWAYYKGRASVISELRELKGPLMVAATPDHLQEALYRLGATGGGTVTVLGHLQARDTDTAAILIRTEMDSFVGNGTIELGPRVENIMISDVHINGLNAKPAP